MSLDSLIDFTLSPAYASMARNLAIIAVLSALVAVGAAFWFYGRGREGSDASGPPWALLMGTFRDSFIITLLYTADSLIAQSSGVQELGSDADVFKLAMSVVSTFAGPVFQILILGVTLMRIVALSRWFKDSRG